MMRCHPIVLLAGLLTVVRAQGQCVARHPSSSFILILRFPLWCNYVLLCVLPLSALYPVIPSLRRYLSRTAERDLRSNLRDHGEIAVSSSSKITEGLALAYRHVSHREVINVKPLFFFEIPRDFSPTEQFT